MSKRKRETSSGLRERRNKIKNMHKKGLTVGEIGKRLRLPYWKVYSDLKSLEKGQSKRQEELQERRNKVRELHAKGLTTAEIREQLSLPYEIVYADIKAIGLKPKGQRDSFVRRKRVSSRQWALERRIKVKNLYEQGLSNREIAENIGTSRNTVHNDLKILGLSPNVTEEEVPKRITSRRMDRESAKVRRAKIWGLYQKGLSVIDIAQTMGEPIAVVGYELKIVTNEKLKERRNRIKRLFKKGFTLGEVARDVGVSVFEVRADLNFLRIRVLPVLEEDELPGADVSEEVESQLRDAEMVTNAAAVSGGQNRLHDVKMLHARGNTNKEIAEILGVSISVVHEDLNTLGLDANVKPYFFAAGADDDRARIEDLYHRGISIKKVGSVVGLPLALVLEHLRALGLSVRRTNIIRPVNLKWSIARVGGKAKKRLEELKFYEVSSAGKWAGQLRVLHGYGWDPEDIAVELGISISKVKEILELLNLK